MIVFVCNKVNDYKRAIQNNNVMEIKIKMKTNGMYAMQIFTA